MYVAIDDTDNLSEGEGQNQGTGARGRELAARLEEAGFGRSEGVTRHQLLVDPRIPYTSHNSAACILLKADTADMQTIIKKGIAFLEAAAPGSDAGLCVAQESQVTEAVVAFGQRGKREVLTKEEAHRLAGASGIHLSGHTGERIGVIGALAAVGLRKGGADGRFLDLKGLRQLRGEQPVELLRAIGIRTFLSQETGPVELRHSDVIDVGEKWPQPVLQHGKPTLLIEQVSEPGSPASWRVVSRDLVKQY